MPGAAWRDPFITHQPSHSTIGRSLLAGESSKPLVRIRGTGQLGEPNLYSERAANGVRGSQRESTHAQFMVLDFSETAYPPQKLYEIFMTNKMFA